MPLTKKKLSKFIGHGRSAIESRMLDCDTRKSEHGG